ncbi:MAG: chromosome segregation protein SMC [Omnitrophica bacterium RIFCSPLOWO2_12_FULL_50_11]|nr:MAG: chromosome segregation protein SMC [Omnitrophica bacterium RIFCSPLOWO2_12_FULL_50_11]
MYLKKVELCGFKSFADRTMVGFEAGVTCIVGPNGCGKSNISDAVRWVLGERSAKLLRGSSMEDVIFSGTDLRKPLNLAEVSLTMDNSDHKLPIDYEEVVITRRLYRSGESEYLINRTTCRLRDIMDLILDTGIGSNSYSMIEQGRIDYILNAQADERRQLIEEAAGISKYKVKKEEALRKLERTEQNLLRLNDIISEAERNIRYAERQAKRAERYKTQLERLKELEIRKAFFELRNQNKVLNELTEKKSERESALGRLEQERTQSQDKLRMEETSFQELEQSFLQAEQARSEAKQELAALEQEERFAYERLEALKLASERALGEIDSLNRSIARLQQEANEKRKLQNDLGKRLSELKEEKEVKRRELESPLATRTIQTTEIQTQETTLFDISHRLSESRNTLNRIRLDRATTDQTRTSLEESRQKSLKVKEALLEKRNSAIKRRSSDEISRAALQENLEQLLRAQTEMSQHRHALATRRDQLHQERSALNNQIIVLQKLNASNGADPQLIVKQFARQNGSQTIKALLDLIEIEPGYEMAVEAILASSLKAVVAEDMATAVSLLTQVEQKHTKPTTILIRDRALLNGAMKNDPEAEAHPAVHSRLWDVVRIQPGYEGIFTQLLGNTYVIDEINSKNAVALAELTQRNRLVTQSGSIFGPKFQITLANGSSATDAGVLVRKRKLEQLNAAVTQVTAQLDSLQSETGNLEITWNEANQKEAKLRDDIRCLDIALERADGVLFELNDQFNHVSEELEVIQKENLEVDRQLATLGRDEQSSLDQVEALEKGEQQTRSLMEQLRKSEESQKQEQARLEQELAQIDNKLELVVEKGKDNTDTLKLLEEQLLHGEERKRSLDEDRDNAFHQIAGWTAKIEWMKQKKSEFQHEVLQRSVVAEQLQQKRSEQIQGRHHLYEQNQELAKTIDTEKQALHELNLEEMELHHQKNSTCQELQNRYRITIQKLNEADYHVSQEAFESIQPELEELRQKVEGADPVNLLAIEEYEQLKQRFEFLDGQRRDLERAKESLLEAIRQINHTTKKLFDETLSKVREAFRIYFQRLFGGGNSDLILVDETHPLDSGLDIVARPPGKKLQHISLLSGGEKALTAIALLFGLFSVRPSPFCIFDEVDASLDEANNDRFLDVLRSFVGHTQVILITHGRKTIGIANALYGVTMQEPGISTMVSVRLSSSNDSIDHEDPNLKTELNQVLN